MNPDYLEILFGGSPRPPFGLDFLTSIRKREVYLRTVAEEQAEVALAWIADLFDRHDVSLDDRFSLSSAALLGYQALIDHCGTQGPEKSEEVECLELEIEIIDEQSSEITSEIIHRKTDCLHQNGIPFGDGPSLADAYCAVFTRVVSCDHGLPRLVTFE